MSLWGNNNVSSSKGSKRTFQMKEIKAGRKDPTVVIIIITIIIWPHHMAS